MFDRLFARARGRYVGQFDLVSFDEVRGWVCDRDHPEAAVRIEILSNGERLGEVTADAPRPDVDGFGAGGPRGFAFAFPRSVAPGSIVARVAGSRSNLTGNIRYDGARRPGRIPAPPIVNDELYTTKPPSDQAAVDLIEGWSSCFPTARGLVAGHVGLFEDVRVAWALDVLGSIAGFEALELGSLEGGHAYMLANAGAHVTAIEANRNCYLRSLIAKEIMGTASVRFLFGDFMPYLDTLDRRFDLIWAAGVLYHLIDPTLLLRRIAAHTDAVYLWTHYIPDDAFDANAAWALTIFDKEDRDVGDGRIVPHYLRSYLSAAETAAYCGGVYRHAAWLRRADILNELRLAGLDDIAIGFEDVGNPSGPCFSLVARRR